MSESEGELKAARNNGHIAPYGGQPKSWYYKPWGAKVLLPSDSESLKNYLIKGWTLTPPINPIPEPEPAELEFVGQTPEPEGTPKKQGELEVSKETVLAVVKAMEEAGYSFVQIDKRTDTPPESETKLTVSQVSTPENGVSGKV